ncbi:MAG: hypothetical protein HYZ65_09495 [Burkholderiales bacterium]|nr:hypothetical protein [Burkholderiales bacterium]
MLMLTALRRLLPVLLLLAMSLTVMAAERSFPANTRRGVLNMAAYPDIVIDGKIKHALPVLRIYNEENLIVMPGTLSAGRIYVHYTENDFGEIDKIWIVTAQEARKPLPKAEAWTPQIFKSPSSN